MVHLPSSDGCLPSCPDALVIKEVFSLRRGLSILCSAMELVGEPKSLNSFSGCHKRLCSIFGITDSPLPRRLAPEKPAGGHQTQCSLYLTARRGWTHTLEKRELSPTQALIFIGTLNQTDGPDVLCGGRIQKSSQSC